MTRILTNARILAVDRGSNALGVVNKLSVASYRAYG